MSTQMDATGRGAALVAAAEAVGLLVYSVFLTIAAFDTSGATRSAPIVEIIIYLVFVLGIALVARGLFRGSATARPPFLLIQIFVLVIAYTVFVGDGTTVKIVGAIIGLLGLAGIGLTIASIARESDAPPPA